MHERLRRGRAGARLARPHPPAPAARSTASCAHAGATLADLDGIAYTQGPGLAGALLVGASVATRLAMRSASRRSASTTSKATCCRRCSPSRAPEFPFVALLVSGGHTQLMRVDGVGRLRTARRDARRRRRRSLRQDREAARPRLSRAGPRWRELARERHAPARFRLPRPMIASGDLDFSFRGLKTAVLTLVARAARASTSSAAPTSRARSRTRSSTCWSRSRCAALERPA